MSDTHIIEQKKKIAKIHEVMALVHGLLYNIFGYNWKTMDEAELTRCHRVFSLWAPARLADARVKIVQHLLSLEDLFTQLKDDQSEHFEKSMVNAINGVERRLWLLRKYERRVFY